MDQAPMQSIERHERKGRKEEGGGRKKENEDNSSMMRRVMREV
jgi:hypothetical protein